MGRLSIAFLYAFMFDFERDDSSTNVTRDTYKWALFAHNSSLTPNSATQRRRELSRRGIGFKTIACQIIATLATHLQSFRCTMQPLSPANSAA